MSANSPITAITILLNAHRRGYLLRDYVGAVYAVTMPPLIVIDPSAPMAVNLAKATTCDVRPSVPLQLNTLVARTFAEDKIPFSSKVARAMRDVEPMAVVPNVKFDP
jgi:hypothetical protein